MFKGQLAFADKGLYGVRFGAAALRDSVALIGALVLAGSLAVTAQAEEDPTRPLGYVAAKGGSSIKGLQLHSVLIGDERKVAVINGQQVMEQESIKGTGGVVVQKILPHEVIVKQGNKSWRISLRSKQVNRKNVREVN